MLRVHIVLDPHNDFYLVRRSNIAQPARNCLSNDCSQGNGYRLNANNQETVVPFCFRIVLNHKGAISNAQSIKLSARDLVFYRPQASKSSANWCIPPGCRTKSFGHLPPRSGFGRLTQISIIAGSKRSLRT